MPDAPPNILPNVSAGGAPMYPRQPNPGSDSRSDLGPDPGINEEMKPGETLPAMMRRVLREEVPGMIRQALDEREANGRYVCDVHRAPPIEIRFNETDDS